MAKWLPLLIAAAFILVVFRQFFFNGLLPIPGDILVGSYFPWYDYQWGFETHVPVKNSAPSDVISLTYPWRYLAIEQMKLGEWPLWDSTSLLGLPLLANFQSAALNPLNILFWFLSFPMAWSVMVVLQPVLIILGSYIYLRSLKLSSLSSLFGGLLFAFSGFSTVWMEYNTIGFTLACIPFIFWSVDRIVQNPRFLNSFLLGAVITFQIFSGYPQIVMYTIFFVSLYFLYRLKLVDWPSKSIHLYVVGIMLGGLLSAVQLIPSWELTNLSIRLTDPTALNAQVLRLPWQHLITFIIPDFFGNPGTGNYWGLGSYDNFAFSLSDIGIVFIVLALLKNISPLFGLLAGAGLLLSILVPDSFLMGASATRMLALVDFFLAVTAAYGLDAFMQNKKVSKRHLGIIVSLCCVIPVIALGAVYLIEGQSTHFIIAARNSLVPLVSVLLGVFILATKFKYWQHLLFGGLLLSTTLSTDKYWNFIPEKILYPTTPVITYLQQAGGRFDREKGELLTSNTWIPYGLEAAAGQNALMPRSTAEYLSIVNGTYPNLPSRFIDLVNTQSDLYPTLDINSLVVLKRGPFNNPDQKGITHISGPRFTKVFEDKTTVVFSNKDNLGRAWFKDSKNKVEIINKKAGLLELRTNNINADELVISQAYFPGWSATIDQSETPVGMFNRGLQSVQVPEGEHEVILKYNPKTFKLGLGITCLTITVLGMYSLVRLSSILKRGKYA